MGVATSRAERRTHAVPSRSRRLFGFHVGSRLAAKCGKSYGYSFAWVAPARIVLSPTHSGPPTQREIKGSFRGYNRHSLRHIGRRVIGRLGKFGHRAIRSTARKAAVRAWHASGRACSAKSQHCSSVSLCANPFRRAPGICAEVPKVIHRRAPEFVRP